MPVWREMTEQIGWRAKHPSQVACFLEDLKCWEAWDTTCGHKAKDITPLVAWRRESCKEVALDDLLWKDERGPSSVRWTWNCFKGNVRETGWETGWSAYGLFWAHGYHKPLNWTYPAKYFLSVNCFSSWIGSWLCVALVQSMTSMSVPSFGSGLLLEMLAQRSSLGWIKTQSVSSFAYSSNVPFLINIKSFVYSSNVPFLINIKSFVYSSNVPFIINIKTSHVKNPKGRHELCGHFGVLPGAVKSLSLTPIGTMYQLV